MLFDVRCAGCATRGWNPCPTCVEALTVAAPAPIVGAATVVCLFDHSGVGREFVHALKFASDRHIAAWLGDAIALRAGRLRLDAVTWAPTTRARVRERGFDQSRRLARRVAGRLGIRARATLRRVGSQSQEGASRQDRLAGPRFQAPPAIGRSVLVIDDVITTGATLSAAVSALQEAGWQRVHVGAVSRTAPSVDWYETDRWVA